MCHKTVYEMGLMEKALSPIPPYSKILLTQQPYGIYQSDLNQ